MQETDDRIHQWASAEHEDATGSVSCLVQMSLNGG